MKFDIVSANFNNSKFIPKFLESINNSSLLPNKLIIVDDASTDNSVYLIKKIKKKLKFNVLLIINKKNLGFATSLNIAIKNIKSEYFARLDPDDYVLKNRFYIQMKFLKKNSNIDILGSNVNYIKLNKKVWFSNNPLSSKKISKLISRGKLPVIHGSIMGRSNSIANFRYKQELVPAEDYDLFAYIIKNEMIIANLKQFLTNVNIHDSSVSNNLQYHSILKKYNICYKYFGYKKSIFGIKLDYYHQLNYRKYLAESSFLRFIFLILSLICNPSKILKRISIHLYDKY